MKVWIYAACAAAMASPALAEHAHYYIPGPNTYCFGSEPPKGQQPDPKLCIACPSGRDPVLEWPDGSKAEITISKWAVKNDMKDIKLSCSPLPN